MKAYLTTGEVARALGLSIRTVRRRIAFGELPTLTIRDGLHRIEAEGIVRDALPVLPPGPPVCDVGWLAGLLRLHPYTVQTLAREGVLPMERAVGGAWEIRRRALWLWLQAHTSSDPAPTWAP